MSYLSDASLVMIPSGVEAGTVFTSKPAGGSADLTFTRSNDTATRVGPNGYIEKVRTNLLLQSNQFDTTWFFVNGSGTVTSGQDGYDGSSDAWLLSKSSASLGLRQNKSLTGIQTFSIYAKAGTLNWIAFENSGSYGYFDLVNGVAGTNTFPYSNIESIGGGWWRISIGYNGSNTRYIVYPADNNNDLSGTSGNIYIQDAQLEVGDIATDYIETTTAAVSVGPVANVPRINFDPVLPRTGSLLLEPQRTNLMLYSEQLDNAAWTIGSATISANATTSPSGYQDADIISTTAANSSAGPVGATIAADSTTYTQSVFVKYISGYENFKFRTALTGGSSVAVASVFNANTGTLVSTESTAQVVDYGNGWYRVSHQITNNGTNTNFIFQLYPSGDAVNTNSMAFWGAQAEAGSYPTSYIPTYGAAVTRGGDACSKTDISSLIGQTEGTLYWEGKIIQLGEEGRVSLSDGSASNRLWIRLLTNGEISWNVYSGGTEQAAITSLSAYSVGDTIKVAATYAANDFKLYINGVEQGTDTSGSVSGWTLDKLDYGRYNGNNPMMQLTKQLIVFPTALTPAELATLTTL